MLAAQTIVFAITWWLGVYLIQRSPDDPLLRWSGGGLLAYGLALATDAVTQRAVTPAPLSGAQWVVFLLPLACWIVAGGYMRVRFTSDYPRRSIIHLALVALLLFALGVGLLVVPLAWLPARLVALAIGGDMIVLGYVVGVLDAFEQGEDLRRDFMRSAVSAAVIALLFGAQIGWLILIEGNATAPLAALLFVTVGLAIAWQTAADWLQRGLDSLVFAGADGLKAEREQLRETAAALPRAPKPPSETPIWRQPEFERWTRRALSQLSNLPKLAASPLLSLPLVSQRLAHRQMPDVTLNRATLLQEILTEAIERLRPPEGSHFSSADAWRFYNALYYPYVVGLRPHSVRAAHDTLTDDAKAALTWFRTQVPPRTLYNWQNAAAGLIAHDLAERCAGASAVTDAPVAA